jgi:hypothetical protein
MRRNAAWKPAIAATMKTSTLATSCWLSDYLDLGVSAEAGRNIAAWLQNPDPQFAKLLSVSTTHHHTL